nr:polyadenylate binding protein [Hymenolepis microstoma]
MTENMTDCVIYVGDLHPLVTLDELAFTFSDFNCQLISAKRAKNGTCFALLRLQKEDDINILMSRMRSLRFCNRPVRLMRFQPNPRLRNVKGANVFVGNIDQRITQEELYVLFSCFGEILSCKIVTDNMQNSRGYGYVQFSKPKYAQRAISASGALKIADKNLIVKLFKPRSVRYPDANVLPFTNCYIKNFDENTTEAQLRELFSEFGEIESIFIPVYPNNVLKGYAFVCFKRFDEAMSAVKNLNGRYFRGRRLYVGRAEKKADRVKALSAYYKTLRETTVHVKNLDEVITEYNLCAFFGQFGKVVSALVVRDEKGHSKGFGFVWFQSPNAAKFALEMHDIILGSKRITLSIPLMPVAITYSRYRFDS